MSKRYAGFGVATAICLLAACSPSLNWRQVNVENLRFSLPCKPDKGQREVTLAAKPLTLSMQGCEADGALFAISHVKLGDATSIPQVMAAWRTAALATMQVPTSQVQDIAAPAIPGVASGAWMTAKGVRPGGGPVHAQLGWLVQGRDVYHLAIYADTLRPELTGPFTSDITKP